MNIQLKNTFHDSLRTFRLPPATDGDFGWAHYLSQRSSRKFLCDYESCKCSTHVRSLTQGFRVLGVDQDGRIAVAPEVACDECRHCGTKEPLEGGYCKYCAAL